MKKYHILYKGKHLYYQWGKSKKQILDSIRCDLKWDKDFGKPSYKKLKDFQIKLD